MAERHAPEKGSEDGVHADPLCGGGAGERDEKCQHENTAGPCGVRLHPRQDAMQPDAAQGQQRQRQGQGSRHDTHPCVSNAAFGQNSQKNREDDPTQEIVEDGRGNHDHSEVSTVEIEVHQRARDHRQSGNRQRRGDEEHE